MNLIATPIEYQQLIKAVTSLQVNDVTAMINEGVPAYVEGEVAALFYAAQKIRAYGGENKPAKRIFDMVLDHDQDLNRPVEDVMKSPGHELFRGGAIYANINDQMINYRIKGGNPMLVDKDPLKYLAKMASLHTDKLRLFIKYGFIEKDQVISTLLQKYNSFTMFEHMVSGSTADDVKTIAYIMIENLIDPSLDIGRSTLLEALRQKHGLNVIVNDELAWMTAYISAKRAGADAMESTPGVKPIRRL